jgi:hypothetical protein
MGDEVKFYTVLSEEQIPPTRAMLELAMAYERAWLERNGNLPRSQHIVGDFMIVFERPPIGTVRATPVAQNDDEGDEDAWVPKSADAKAAALHCVVLLSRLADHLDQVPVRVVLEQAAEGIREEFELDERLVYEINAPPTGKLSKA